MLLQRLNPYYTGIHLHTIMLLTRCMALVLILIILEYIYIKRTLEPQRIQSVLILIILEYIYISVFHPYRVHQRSLNPYYTGIHLHVKHRDIEKLLDNVLILIILEYIYIIILRAATSNMLNVLILIILEYIYI